MKKLSITRGKGTKSEKRIGTDINGYWSQTLKRWVTIPQG